MANSNVIRVLGPSIGMSVVATAHAAVTVPLVGNDQCNYCNVVNTSATLSVAVLFSLTGVAATLPGDGTSGSYTLPPMSSVNMAVPVSYNAANLLQVTAIASAAGPTLVTITPIGDQS